MTIRSLSFLTLLCLAAGAARADSLIEHKTLMAEDTAKSWTSGLKQRTEVTLPFVGLRPSITRVDRGVTWDLDPKNKTYTERPIALPYSPDTRAGSGGGKKGSASKESAPPDTECTAEVKPMKKERAIAGLASSGYRMACKESPGEATILWVSPHTPLTKKVMAEQQAYSEAYSKALFANYPAKERGKLAGGMSAMAGLFTEMPRMVSGGAIPNGMWTAVEMETDEGDQTLFELVRASAKPVNASLFEIPDGYTKVKENKMGMDFSGMKKEAGKSAGEEVKKKGMGALFKGLRDAAGQ